MRVIRLHIAIAKESIHRIVRDSRAADAVIISNVRVAFPYKFTHVLGATAAFLGEYPEALKAINDNMRDEVTQDHVGMAIRFAAAANAVPSWENEAHMEPICNRIRQSFAKPAHAAKYGIALLAMLETTSQIFIPDLAMRAKRLGSTDLEFCDVHGVADIDHAEELCRAAAIVYGNAASGDEELLASAIADGVAFIGRIYAPLQ
jgi:hypothetical protein